MGKHKTQRKNAAMLDSDYDYSSVSRSSTMWFDSMSWSAWRTEEDQLEKDSLLDQALDALYGERGSTREKALSSIIEAFNSNLQHQFVEKKFATLLHQCLHSIKRGSRREIALASHAIGLLALTVGCGDNAHGILEESVTPLSRALNSGSESSDLESLVKCLAIITFVGGNGEETEQSMQIMWQLVHPNLCSNVVAVNPSAALITATVSAWTFLLTTLEAWKLHPKHWQQSISYFSGLLDKDDRSVRIAAGEALALIFEKGSIAKFSAEAKGIKDGSQEEYVHIKRLKGRILNQAMNLSMEAGGKGSAKKDLTRQRNLFKDILQFLVSDCCPETSLKICEESLKTSTWSQLIQLNFLKHFLGGTGFVNHLKDNEFLQDVFGFTPRSKHLPVQRMSSTEKRLYKSSNSIANKSRSKLRNKDRMISQVMKAGHYAINA